MTTRIIAAALLAAAIAGCGGSGGEPVTEDTPVDRPDHGRYFSLAPAQDLSIPATWPAGKAVLHSQIELDTIWATATADYFLPGPGQSLTPPIAPVVDFSRHALVWVSEGMSGTCASFGIRRITRRGFDYTVEWGYQDPPPDTVCAAVVTLRLDMSRVPQPAHAVTFIRRDICSPSRTEKREYCI